MGSRAHGVQLLLVAPWHVESSRTRDGTHVPYIGRQILSHWTIMEVLTVHFKAVIYIKILSLESPLLRNIVTSAHKTRK